MQNASYLGQCSMQPERNVRSSDKIFHFMVSVKVHGNTLKV